MQLTNDWYYFTGAIDVATCQKIIGLGGDKFEAGHVDRQTEISEEERKTGTMGDPGLDAKSRMSEIKWISEQWVRDLIVPYMETANEKAGWKFDVKAAEAPQLTRYEKGGFYDWHSDGPGDHLSTYTHPENQNSDGHVRQLSMTILLNDDFDGGAFQFSALSKANVTIENPSLKGAGSIIIFPSFLEHRITTVSRGVRFSLVAWFLGPPFK